MPSEPYLIRLASRLAAGLAELPAERRERHRAFILSQQTPDGGFRGREGDSDLYYTSFAVRGLLLLGGLTPEDCERIGRYLASHQQSRLSVIDLVSWLSTGLAVQLAGGDDPLAGAAADFADRVAATLESVRTRDGGYAKSPEGALGSTYHSFLVALTYELLGRPVPRPNALVQFLYDRQRDDGGFVEIDPMKRSGANPTAAAAALLTLLGAMDDEIRDDVRTFLREVRSSEGGFQANTRIPFADGLSTFTGLLTTQDLGLGDLLDPAQVENYAVNCLEIPTGGFRGASWDEQADVEYTFYGLRILALLSMQ
jgi:geranylgeranyl transferase type-2 subunit beta